MPDLLERLTAALADRYAVESEIGRGGMAAVFLAEDLKHHRKVAVKVMHPEISSDVATERFFREIEIVAGLTHPHILPLHDSGQADGLLYCVVPYIEGESLLDRLLREKQLPVEDALQITREVAEALGYAHERGIIHRDIKPANILLQHGHALVADFGIARAVEQAGGARITQTGVAVGTPAYMSPEQGGGSADLDGRSDIYSLGCVLYEMLAGEPPYTGVTPQAVIRRHSLDPVPSVRTIRDTVPESAGHAITKALAKIPADRFATAILFAQALQTTGVASRRRAISMWPLVAVALIAAATGIWLISQREGNGPVSSGAVERAAGTIHQVQLTENGSVTDAAVSPDGLYLAFSSRHSGGGIGISVRDIEGVQPEKILAVVDVLWDLGWTPDGSAVTFVGTYMGQSNSYAVSRSGGTVRIAESANLLSPDGHENAVMSQTWRYLLVTPTDTEPVSGEPQQPDSIPIEGLYDFVMGATYSPRGDYFAVTTADGSGRSAIRAVSRDGDDQRIVAEEGVAIVGAPYWRSDGEVLYYVRVLSSGPELVRLATSRVGEPSGEPEPILQLGDSLIVEGISADSRMLVATAVRKDTRIARLRRVEGDSVRVDPIAGTEGAAAVPYASFIRQFSVSPDGRWLAFLLGQADAGDIYRVPIEGGMADRLTTVGTVGSFAWSSDGRLLSFIASWQDTLRVWFQATGGGPPALLRGSSPSWVVSWAPGPLMYSMPGNRNWRIVESVRVDQGTELVPLTSVDPAAEEIAEGEATLLVANDSVGFMFSPAASPDGEWVAVQWSPDSGAGLWKISLTDSAQVLVRADTRSSTHYPSGWTADSRAILSRVDNEILLIPADGGEPDVVLSLPPESDYSCDPLLSESDSSFVCLETSSESDVWLVENFDPHLN
jgi:Tol biopolymer transport system component/tRNA A-37 threonylcarbamoyl transferase component Bud32